MSRIDPEVMKALKDRARAGITLHCVARLRTRGRAPMTSQLLDDVIEHAVNCFALGAEQGYDMGWLRSPLRPRSAAAKRRRDTLRQVRDVFALAITNNTDFLNTIDVDKVLSDLDDIIGEE